MARPRKPKLTVRQQWERVAEESTDPGRRQRGRKYASEGRVYDVEYGYDLVEAYVQGSEDAPYHVWIALGRKNGPPRERPPRCGCECPDPEPVCKHAVALMDQLGAMSEDEEVTPPTPAQDPEPEPEQQTWSGEPPEVHGAFWMTAGEINVEEAAEGDPEDILEQLGDLTGWRGSRPFYPAMRAIYATTARHAESLLSERAAPPRPAAPPQEHDGREQSRRETTTAERPRVRSDRKCTCPECVRERNQSPGVVRRRTEKPREDTVLAGMYDDYLIRQGYEWTPCGRRLQPAAD